jgi:hypothetical protein
MERVRSVLCDPPATWVAELYFWWAERVQLAQKIWLSSLCWAPLFITHFMILFFYTIRCFFVSVAFHLHCYMII